MKIKRFNQILESKSNNHFPITNEDIEDLCLEMTDIGFEVRIERRYINQDAKITLGQGTSKSITNEPLSSKSIPIYEIRLVKKSDEDSGPERWNGGLYFEDVPVISSFSSISRKFASFYKDYKVLYNIRGSEYNIRIILNEIETEIGFDWHTFCDNLNDKLDDLPTPFDMTDNFVYGDIRKEIEIYQKITREEMIDKLDHQILDNKSDFDQITKYVDKLTESDVKLGNISVQYKYSERRPFTHQPKKETIFSKKIPPMKFRLYDLDISIENLSHK